MQTKLLTPDGIPVKFIKMSVYGIDSHLVNVLNKDRGQNLQSIYSENIKTVRVRPIFNKDNRTKIKNYQYVNLLNI